MPTPWTNPLFKQTLQYYLNLVTSQYRQSPNFGAWQAAQLQPFDDLTNAIQFVNYDYDIDNAIGVQLDELGVIIGVSRKLPFAPTDGSSSILNDTDYRILLRATQARNTWNGKTVSLYPIWAKLFPGASLIVHDNQNMSATIIIGGTGFTNTQIDMIKNGMIVPRPEGVLYNYVTTSLPIFGFDLNDNIIAGFDAGHFA